MDGSRRSELAVLLVSSDGKDFRRISGLLRNPRLGGLRLECVDSLARRSDPIYHGEFDVVMVDLRLCFGEDPLAIRRLCDDVAVVILASARDESMALEVMRAGAHDYLVKTRLTTDLLERSLHHAVLLQRSITQLREDLGQQVVGMSMLAATLKEELEQQDSPHSGVACRLFQCGVAARSQIDFLMDEFRDHTGRIFTS